MARVPRCTGIYGGLRAQLPKPRYTVLYILIPILLHSNSQFCTVSAPILSLHITRCFSLLKSRSNIWRGPWLHRSLIVESPRWRLNPRPNTNGSTSCSLSSRELFLKPGVRIGIWTNMDVIQRRGRVTRRHIGRKPLFLTLAFSKSHMGRGCGSSILSGDGSELPIRRPMEFCS